MFIFYKNTSNKESNDRYLRHFDITSKQSSLVSNKMFKIQGSGVVINDIVSIIPWCALTAL